MLFEFYSDYKITCPFAKISNDIWLHESIFMNYFIPLNKIKSIERNKLIFAYCAL